MPSYTPEHRRAVLEGLRILARVAIRSYMEEQAAASPRAETQEDGGGGWTDGVWGKEAEAGAGLGSLRWRSCTTGGRTAGAAAS